MIFAFLYTQVFFGVVHVIWCYPQGFEGHRNLGLLPHDQCGHSNASPTIAPRIREGDDPCIARPPWIVKLYVQDAISGKFFLLCTSTLINNRYVLSAAHCVVDYNYQYLSVGCGGTCKFKNDLYFKVESVTIHPKFSSCEGDFSYSFKNDISLIRLEKEIELKDNIQPICLPFGIFGFYLETAGWVELLYGMVGMDTIQCKSMSLLPKSKCTVKGIKSLMIDTEAAANIDKLKLTCFKPLDWTQLCVSGGAGKSDSGAPLMKSIAVHGKPTYFIFGIASYDVLYVTTTYTAVNKFLKWILDQIKP